MSFSNIIGELDQYYNGQGVGAEHQQPYPLTPPGIIGGGGSPAPPASAAGTGSGLEDQRALQVALELSKLGMTDAASFLTETSPELDAQQAFFQALANGYNPASFRLGSLATIADDLRFMMPRKSQNLTECVPVPSCEHVAEIVGRQGCKIKALRAKTNTYIKTPVRGEEPVFVVTGRKDDVAAAKREIISAADHFSQIRASRGTATGSSAPAPIPGQITAYVKVPYRVVGLVVGPKGATIKRIQQQTRTYIVTPSRDKDPVFEVTGLPENVEMAKTEIEAHIAIRTGSLPMEDQSNMLDQEDLSNSRDLLASLYKNGLCGLNGLGGLEGIGMGLGAINSLSSSLSSSEINLAQAVQNGFGNGGLLNNGGSAGSSNSGGGSVSSLSSLNGFSAGNATTSAGGTGATTSIINRLPALSSHGNMYGQLSDLGFSFLDNVGQNGFMSSSSHSDDNYLFGGSGSNGNGDYQTKLSDLFASIGTSNSTGFTSSLWGHFDRDEGLGESPTPEASAGTNFM